MLGEVHGIFEVPPRDGHRDKLDVFLVDVHVVGVGSSGELSLGRGLGYGDGDLVGRGGDFRVGTRPARPDVHLNSNLSQRLKRSEEAQRPEPAAHHGTAPEVRRVVVDGDLVHDGLAHGAALERSVRAQGFNRGCILRWVSLHVQDVLSRVLRDDFVVRGRQELVLAQ